MHYVNFLVALGGDTGNTVPKFFVPVSEVPVLQALHGQDALFDFEQVDPRDDQEQLSNRDELVRLHSIYGHVVDREGAKILPQIYGGAGARVLTSIDDLDIPEGAFKATERAKPRSKAKAEDEDDIDVTVEVTKKAAGRKPAAKKKTLSTKDEPTEPTEPTEQTSVMD